MSESGHITGKDCCCVLVKCQNCHEDKADDDLRLVFSRRIISNLSPHPHFISAGRMTTYCSWMCGDIREIFGAMRETGAQVQ